MKTSIAETTCATCARLVSRAVVEGAHGSGPILHHEIFDHAPDCADMLRRVARAKARMSARDARR